VESVAAVKCMKAGSRKASAQQDAEAYGRGIQAARSGLR